ncbi:MAG: PAS domain S-box protein, partial [Thermomicrobiales bacterium]
MVDQHHGSPGQRPHQLNTRSSSSHVDRFRSLLDELQDAAIVADDSGRCLAANRAAEALLGYERDTLPGRGVSSLIAHGRRGVELRRLLSGQWTGEMQARHKSNRLIAIDVWATRVADASGDTSLVIMRRGRDRDGAEGSVAGPAAANGATAKTAVTMTLDGVITGWSPAAERLYGYSEDEAVGRSFFVLAPPELAEEIAGLVEQARRGEGVTAYRTVQVTRTGCRIDVCLEIAPVTDRDGHVVAASAIVHDVIGCLRAEQELQEAQAKARDAYRALRESEERFRGAFAGASIGMALVSPEGRFLQVNPALCAIVGYGEDELLATTFQQITHPDDVAADGELRRQL